MALQGTIDAFPVANVLQLLAGSNKTGRLMVEGDRSTAQLFVADGRVTGGSIRDGGDGDMADVVLELLRYRAGSFLFEPGAIAPDGSRSEDLDDLVSAANDRLAAWVAVEQVVPSMRHRITLVPVVGPDGVRLSPTEWQVVVAGAANAEVAQLAELGVGSDLEACRVVADLVERGVVAIEGPGSDLVLSAGPIEAATAVGAVEMADDPEPQIAARPTASDAQRPEPGASMDPGSEIIEAELVPVEELPVDGPVEEPVAEESHAYEVVLIDEEDERGTTAFPEHFPIDDLLGADEEEDPWVTLENAGREDRLAAAQDFGTDQDFGAATGHGDAEGGSAAFADGYTVGAFSSDGFDTGPMDRSPSAGSDAAALAGPNAAAMGGIDPLDVGSRTGDPTAPDGFDAPRGAVFSGEGAFTDAPVAVRDPLITASGARAADTAADEVLRQMSKLSPKAAEAIAAALGSDADQAPGTAPGGSGTVSGGEPS